MSLDNKYAVPAFDVSETRGGAPINCPNCGQAWTHIVTARVWPRDEDGPDHGYEIPDNDPPRPISGGNPSPRRDAVEIEMSCEQCDRRFALVASQHKGNTFVGVRVMPRRRELAPTPTLP